MLKVLLLEDSPRDVELIRELLVDAGFDVDMDCTELEKDFVSLLRSRTYDIILSDFNLRGFDGFTALRWAMEICPNVPFICVSGTIGEEAAVGLLKQGAVDYVLKDRLTRLPSAIKRAVGEAKEKELREQSEEALLESEERYRLLAEASPEMIYLVGRDGRLLYVNTAAASQFHTKPTDLIGKHLTEIFPPQIARQNLEGIKKVIDSKKESVREVIQQFPSGEKWIDARLTPVMDANGEISAVLGLSSDITERKRAEEELQKLANVVKYSSELVNLCTLDGKMVFLNEAGSKMLGISPDEVEQTTVMQVIPTHFKEMVENELMPALANTGTWTGDLQYLNLKNGRLTDVHATTFAIKDPTSGAPLYLANVSLDITERKKAEEQIRSLEKKYRDIFDNALEGIYQSTPDGRFITVNPAFALMLGYDDVAELISSVSSIGEQIFADENRRLEWKRLLEQRGYVNGFEAMLVRKDGSALWVSENARAVKDTTGSIMYYEGMVQDITERKRAEAELFESETKYRQLVARSPDGIFIIDFSGRFLSVNNAMCDNLKYTEEELLSMKLWDVVPQEYRSLHKQRLAAIMSGETPNTAAEYEVTGKDGIVHSVEVLSVPYYKGKEIVGFQGIARDTTERLRTEKQVALLAHTIKSINECVSITDTNDTVLFVNEAFLETYGYSEHEILGNNINVLRSPSNPPEVTRGILTATLAEGWSGELLNRTKDGRDFPVSLSTSCVRDDDGQVVALVGVAIDITERKRAEEELRKLANVVKYSGELINLATLDGKMIFLNEAGSKMLGISPAEVEQTNIMQVIPAHFKKTVENELLPALLNSGTWTGDLQYLNLKNGRLTDVRATTFTINDPTSGAPQYLANISLDITKRKEAEDALKNSEARFRSVWEGTIDGMRITDKEGTIVAVNDAYCQLVGITKEELEGQSFNNVYKSSEEDSQLATQHYKETFLKRVISPKMEATLDLKDGRVVSVDMSNAFLDSASRQPLLLSIFRDITERKRAEEALKQSSQKWEAIVEASPDGIGLVSLDGKLQLMSNKLLAMYGHSVEQKADIYGRTIFDFIDPSDHRRLSDNIRKLLGAEKNFRISEYLAIKKDNSRFYVEASSTVLFDSKSNPESILFIERDITERKRTEEILHASEERFRSVWQNSADGMRLTDKDGRIVNVNEAYCRMVKIPAEKLTDEFFSVVYQRGGPDDDIRIYQKRFETEEIAANVSTTAMLWNAEMIDLEISNSLIRIPGQEKMLLSIFRDVTERKKAEEERQRLTTAFDQTAEAILVTDPRGIIQYTNPAFERITGYPREEAVGRSPSIMKSGQQDAGFYKQLWDTISAGRKWSGRFINKKKDGTLFTDETSISPVLNEKGEIINYVGIKRDVTSELALESHWIEAQKLESVGTLASGIAHDFNNILGIILGYATLIERDPPTLPQSVASIKAAVKRGANLVRQILTFARKTDVVFGPLQVDEMLKEIVKMLGETFPRTIDIVLELEPTHPSIIADATQVHQAILNLCVNARDAMPNGGVITLRTKIIDGRSITAFFPDIVSGNFVHVAVIDTGIGMDEQTRARVFDPFFTTKEKGKGTGLGLSVVYGVMRGHKGYVHVESVPGKGSEFSLYFPIAKVAGDAVSEKPAEQQKSPGGRETLLVVEDEEALSAMLKATLEASGYRFLPAMDGLRALEVYRAHRAEIELVVTDMGLPKITGEQLFFELKKLNPAVKVIMASGYFEPNSRSEMLKAGVKDFIQKPYSPDELLKQIRDVLDQHPQE